MVRVGVRGSVIVKDAVDDDDDDAVVVVTVGNNNAFIVWFNTIGCSRSASFDKAEFRGEKISERNFRVLGLS